MLSREHLEKFTLVKLQELLHLGVTVPPKDREKCIDMILDLFEIGKMRAASSNQQVHEAVRAAIPLRSSAAHSSPEVSDISIDQSPL